MDSAISRLPCRITLLFFLFAILRCLSCLRQILSHGMATPAARGGAATRAGMLRSPLLRLRLE
ncbi:hypothetical protein [Streptomyces lydicus]|uniref:hypothetical protein n=1 Tax=Streptomyces lydicus TaxID=47763 RepID=UPI0037BDEB75